MVNVSVPFATPEYSIVRVYTFPDSVMDFGDDLARVAVPPLKDKLKSSLERFPVPLEL